MGNKTQMEKEQTKERLLGYLLNALDDGEAAQVEKELERSSSLRAELAALQREISPLDRLGDSVEPPPGLASRTCNKIWNALDRGDSDCLPNSGIFLDSAYYSPEAVLPSFLLMENSETKEIEKEKPLAAKKIKIEDEPPVRSTPWVGLIASVSVGILASLVLFPMINYVKRSTQSHVTETWMNEINRRVDQYEQIHGNPWNASNVEELPPYNLALHGWLEVPAEIFINAENNSREMERNGAVLTRRRSNTPSPFDMFIKDELSGELNAHEVVRGQQPLRLPHFEGLDEPIPLDAERLAEYMLLLVPGQAIPVRSAFGQDFLFRDGRVFSRELPRTR